MNKEELIKFPSPSAGRIIRGISPIKDKFGGIPNEVLERAKLRGIWVHEAIESEILHDKHDENWEWEGYIEAFQNFNKDYSPKYLETELCIANDRAKGIVDAIAEIDGRKTMIDFKTSTVTDTMAFELQLGIYKWILDELGLYDIEELLIVKIAKDGTYRVLHYYYDQELVLSAIRMYEYFTQVGITKGK